MTLSRQVRRRFERTGQLPKGWSWISGGYPRFRDANGNDIGTSVHKVETSIGTIIFASILLTGCASTPIVRPDTPLADRIPSSLLSCADRPSAGSLDRQSDVARFVVELDAAGEDCRRKVGAVRQIVEGDR